MQIVDASNLSVNFGRMVAAVLAGQGVSTAVSAYMQPVTTHILIAIAVTSVIMMIISFLWVKDQKGKYIFKLTSSFSIQSIFLHTTDQK